MKSENRDALTGLANWNYVSSILPGILGHNGQVALIFVDIDGMRHWCNNFGHGLGDGEIQRIALKIARSCGENALVFRLGGDEFGAILYEASLEEAREVAETIRATGYELQLAGANGTEVRAMTLSLGIAHFPTHVSNAENLIRAAEFALQRAKEGGHLTDGTSYGGRNRVLAIGDFVDEPEQSAEVFK